MVDYWVKCVNKDGDTLELIEATEELNGGPREKIPRSALVANLKAGNEIKTAHQERGRWTEGDRVVIHDRWVTVEGKEPDEDDLGGLAACKI